MSVSFRPLALAALLAVSCAARADIVTLVFDEAFAVPTAQATATFTLRPDGTVAAHVEMFGSPNGEKIGGFAFNGPVQFPSSNHPDGIVAIGGAGTHFGSFYNGWSDSNWFWGGTLNPIDWTIGTEGMFRSATELFVPNERGYIATAWSGMNVYGAKRFTVANDVPEPASLALVGLGIAGAAFARRRKS